MSEHAEAWPCDGVTDGYGHLICRKEIEIKKLTEALQWALAEIDGRTKYENEGQRSACLDKARSALSQSQQNTSEGE